MCYKKTMAYTGRHVMGMFCFSTKWIKVGYYNWSIISSLSIVVARMAGSVKLFQIYQKFQRTIGIAPLQSNQEQHSISARSTFYLIAVTQLAVTPFLFLLFVATSMFEYAFGFFVTANQLKGLCLYVLFAWQWENTLKYIEYCEEFIAKSK